MVQEEKRKENVKGRQNEAGQKGKKSTIFKKIGEKNLQSMKVMGKLHKMDQYINNSLLWRG